jgi:hypothetical protein
MNVRLAALSIVLVASAGACPAFAGPQEGGMRFKYAPNIFPLEQPRVPQNDVSTGGKPVHPAMEGKVPHGPSFLGVDPNFLRPAPAPRQVQTHTQVAMHPSPVSINSPFRSSFGAPEAPPPQAAQPKMLPSFGSPSALPQSSSNKAVAGKLMPHKSQPVSANRSVAGKLLPRRHPAGQPASALALKPIESYGFGYTPGRYMPVSSSSGMSTRTSLSGRILNPHKH